MSVLKTAGKALLTLVPASELARLGLPALWSVEALIVLVLAGIGWIVIDKDRSANLALILGRGRRAPREAQAPLPLRQPGECAVDTAIGVSKCHPSGGRAGDHAVARHARGGEVH